MVTVHFSYQFFLTCETIIFLLKAKRKSLVIIFFRHSKHSASTLPLPHYRLPLPLRTTTSTTIPMASLPLSPRTKPCTTSETFCSTRHQCPLPPLHPPPLRHPHHPVASSVGATFVRHVLPVCAGESPDFVDSSLASFLFFTFFLFFFF